MTVPTTYPLPPYGARLREITDPFNPDLDEVRVALGVALDAECRAANVEWERYAWALRLGKAVVP